MGGIVTGALSGFGRMQAGRFAAAERKRQAQLGRIQADEVSAALTSELNETLGNIDAALGASLRDPTGPTAAALREQTTSAAQTEITRERFNRIMRVAAQERAGRFALSAGRLGFATDLIRGTNAAAQKALGVG